MDTLRKKSPVCEKKSKIVHIFVTKATDLKKPLKNA